MSLKRKDGFTITEVIIAIVVLTVGLLGLVTTAALVTRMIGRGHRATQAALLAQEQMEDLRAQLLRLKGCAVIPLAGSNTSGAYARSWRIVAAGNARRIHLYVTYPGSSNRMRTDSLLTSVSCAP